MKQINGLFSLLSATAISTLAWPAFANTATTQVGTQSTTINGDNNQVIQVINQVNVSHPGLGRGRTQNTQRATTQDSYQAVGIEGSGNAVYQESSQMNGEERAHPSRPRVAQNRRPNGRSSDDDSRARKSGDNAGRERDCDDDDDD